MKFFYYFAYGSCMNRIDFHRTMVDRGKRLHYENLGLAKLNDYRLEYNAYSVVRQGGVLDIEASSGDKVIGVLYKLSEQALRQVDMREGSKYQRVRIEVDLDGQRLLAYTYVIIDKAKTSANRDYSSIVYRAMKENKFPEEYIERYVKLVRESIYGTEENYFDHCYSIKKERKAHLVKGHR